MPTTPALLDDFVYVANVTWPSPPRVLLAKAKRLLGPVIVAAGGPPLFGGAQTHAAEEALTKG
jgi:hypothetical protein